MTCNQWPAFMWSMGQWPAEEWPECFVMGAFFGCFVAADAALKECFVLYPDLSLNNETATDLQSLIVSNADLENSAEMASFLVNNIVINTTLLSNILVDTEITSISNNVINFENNPGVVDNLISPIVPNPYSSEYIVSLTNNTVFGPNLIGNPILGIDLSTVYNITTELCDLNGDCGCLVPN